MKNLRRVACLLLAFASGPLFAQQSSQMETSRAAQFSFQEMIESGEFQTIVMMVLVTLGGLCLVYLLGAMALGMVGNEKENTAQKNYPERRASMPGAESPRVPLKVERGATVLRAAAHQDNDKRPDRKGNPSSGRG